MPRLPRSRLFWSAAFVLWAGLLWFLSSRTGDMQDLPSIPFADKIAHFAYFAAGGAIVSAIAFVRRPDAPRWTAILLLSLLAAAVVGALDEYHQSFVPGRSGNDPFDWLADVLGGLAGSLFLRLFHRVILR